MKNSLAASQECDVVEVIHSQVMNRTVLKLMTKCQQMLVLKLKATTMLPLPVPVQFHQSLRARQPVTMSILQRTLVEAVYW